MRYKELGPFMYRGWLIQWEETLSVVGRWVGKYNDKTISGLSKESVQEQIDGLVAVCLNVSEVQGKDRDDLWQVACGGYPHLRMVGETEIDSDIWNLTFGLESTPEEVNKEIRTLASCIKQQFKLIGEDESEWLILPNG